MLNRLEKRVIIGVALLLAALLIVISCIVIAKKTKKPQTPAASKTGSNMVHQDETTTKETTTTEEEPETTGESTTAKTDEETTTTAKSAATTTTTTTKPTTVSSAPSGNQSMDAFISGFTASGSSGADTTAPVLIAANTSTVKVGSKYMPGPTFCVDDRDKNVKITYEGTYDLNTVGTYPNIVRVATDASGNFTKKTFTLNVVEKIESGGGSTSTAPKVPVADAIAKYKNDNTKIGIDVSRWQGDINWTKVKESGVEFVMMRLGVQNGFHGERYVDKCFVSNYKGAKAAGLPVGVYFYSCSTCAADAAEDARFVYKTLTENGCSPDLPIAFDWEDWSGITTAGMSLNDLNDSLRMFTGALSAAGYKTCLYQSKYYLASGFWYNPGNYNIWLAQYYDRPTYEGKFFMWQFSCTGQVPGINGDCDLDVMYLS